MTYKHILVAVELSEDSYLLIDKAITLAKQFNSDISLVHIDSTHGEIYTELFDLKIQENRENVRDSTSSFFDKLTQYSEIAIKHALVGVGNISTKLPKVIDKYDVDLLICGHHHDFWSHIVSTSRQLINTSSVDILVVPIEEQH